MKKLLPCLLLSPLAAALAQPAVRVNLQAGAVIALPAGAAPSALAVADYNQDSRPDIAVCQRGLNSVAVYLQSVDAAFPNAPVGTYAAGQAPSGVVAVPLGKFPARPYIDLVAVSGPSNAYTLLTNHNDGSGTFTPVANANFSNVFDTSVNPQLLARDLNGDGWIDFAYTLDPAPPVTFQAGVYWQSLQSPTRVSTKTDRYQTGYRPASLALDDFNRDGVVDVVATNPAGNEFTVVLAGSSNGPNWSFNAGVQRLPSAGAGPVSVATGDVNADLLPDIVLAHEGSAELTLFLNSRSTQFGSPAAYPLSAAPRQVLLQDLNNDRLPELLVLTADGQLQVFQHTAAAGVTRYGTPAVFTTGPNPVTMQVADLNNDFLPDVVVGCAGDHTVRVFLNRSGVVSAARAPQLAGVEVYPNPATDRVTVLRSHAMQVPLTATLLDALGREVRRAVIAAPSTAVSVADVPRGVYLLRLSAPEGVLTQRLVVE